MDRASESLFTMIICLSTSNIGILILIREFVKYSGARTMGRDSILETGLTCPGPDSFTGAGLMIANQGPRGCLHWRPCTIPWHGTRLLGWEKYIPCVILCLAVISHVVLQLGRTAAH